MQETGHDLSIPADSIGSKLLPSLEDWSSLHSHVASEGIEFNWPSDNYAITNTILLTAHQIINDDEYEHNEGDDVVEVTRRVWRYHIPQLSNRWIEKITSRRESIALCLCT